MRTAGPFDRFPSFCLQTTFNINNDFLIAQFLLQSGFFFSYIGRYHRPLALVRAGTQP